MTRHPDDWFIDAFLVAFIAVVSACGLLSALFGAAPDETLLWLAKIGR